MAFTTQTATGPPEDSVSPNGDLHPDAVSPIKHEPLKVPQHVDFDRTELLGFKLSIGYLVLLDCSMRQFQVSITAQLYGGFSLSEYTDKASHIEHGVPKQGGELICYRRNLFQITGSVALPPGILYVFSPEGNRIPILAQELTVCAIETVKGKSIEMILVPHKKSLLKESIVGQLNNAESPPPISLDITKVQNTSNGLSNFPFTWRRLQFNAATKNNGKSQNLQQKFVIRLQLMATICTGVKISIAEIQSGPLVVRGRSPQNFRYRGDVSLDYRTA